MIYSIDTIEDNDLNLAVSALKLSYGKKEIR